MAVIRSEGTNARGEPSNPRVDLIAVGEILDRAVRALERAEITLRALGQDPGADHYTAEAQCLVALREIRALRCRRKRRLRWTRERD